MTAKEQLISILDFVGEREASQILAFAKQTFILKTKTWDDVEEDGPISDEVAAFEEYRAAQKSST